MAYFVDISTGRHSLASSFKWRQQDSIENAKRLEYLEVLRSLNLCERINKGRIPWLSASSLQGFLQTQN